MLWQAKYGFVGRGPVDASSGGGATLTYTVTDATQTNTTGNSFSSVGIGTATSDRIVVISMVSNSNSSLNGTVSAMVLTNGIDTINLTQAAQFGNANNTNIWYGLASTAAFNHTTATVTFTAPFISNAVIMAATLTGSATASVLGTSGSNYGGGGSTADPRGVPNDCTAVSTATGGIVVLVGQMDRTSFGGGGYQGNNTSSPTPDYNVAGGIAAGVFCHGTSGSPGINNAANFNAGFGIASFQP